jgi:hypothetical protein
LYSCNTPITGAEAALSTVAVKTVASVAADSGAAVAGTVVAVADAVALVVAGVSPAGTTGATHPAMIAPESKRKANRRNRLLKRTMLNLLYILALGLYQ